METTATASKLDSQIAARLAALRTERGWPLEHLAQKTGISRATLSRLERCEMSPTAAMLSLLCEQYGWTLSRLMAEAEGGPPSVVRAGEQVIWEDPGTGYIRRVLSPPHSNLRGELAEIILPVGAVVTYESAPVPGLEHHLWMLDGVLALMVESKTFRLERGDCVRYVLFGPSRFECAGKKPVRYVIAMVRP